MNLREATAADIRVIQALAHATWPVAYADILSHAQIVYMLDLMYGTPALEAQLGPKGHRFLLAEAEGTAVGFAGYERGYTPGRSRLHKLYVLPANKGQGIGHALLEAVLVACMKAGDTAVELDVNKRNPAKAFVERLG
ncbi:MAG: GNAT family N-acetyltransferase, partial [Flavobacteriales bacterium]